MLLEIVLRLHQVQMRGDLIFHIVHIEGTIITKAVINGFLVGDYLR